MVVLANSCTPTRLYRSNSARGYYIYHQHHYTHTHTHRHDPLLDRLGLKFSDYRVNFVLLSGSLSLPNAVTVYNPDKVEQQLSAAANVLLDQQVQVCVCVCVL